MKGLLKIIAIPFIIALTLIVAFASFIFSISEWICTAAAGLLAVGAVVTLATGGALYTVIGLFVMAFLISPYGIVAVIEWFIGLLDSLNCSLKSFVTS